MATSGEAAPVGGGRGGLRWWREVVYVAAFYGLYTLIRNRGLASHPEVRAFANARSVIDLERRLGIYNEESVQDAFLDWEWFIGAWNVFYGSAHFLVTAAALVWLFRRAPDGYRRWRNILALTTALALVGFAFFPLMPPRLLPPAYGFVDTLAEVGGLWSFDSGTVARISNQYAAMPSLHFAWSLWSALVLWQGVRRRWARALVASYPVLTLFAVVVTANHYWLDAAGGAAVLGAGAAIPAALARWQSPRHREERDARSEEATV
jgi:hypothetical protein